MSSLSSFSESAGSSSSVRAMSKVSRDSPLISEEASGNDGIEAFEQPIATGMLPSEIAESNLPHCQGYEWASSLVIDRFLGIGGCLWFPTMLQQCPCLLQEKQVQSYLLNAVLP